MAVSLPNTFRVSPLIRLTLLFLYISLTLPLPFLAQVTHAPVPPSALAVGLAIGAIVLYGALAEQVILTDSGIEVTYPRWIRWLLRRGWFLSWQEVKSLKPRSTGQGGLVYYFVSQTGQGYLLPMRVAGFARLVDQVQAQTGIDTSAVRPLAQPWMYLILLGVTLLLFALDLWTIATSLSTPLIALGS
ncbi:MAG: hypothetical protein ACO4CG_16400 [Prochlorothrix sp.]